MSETRKVFFREAIGRAVGEAMADDPAMLLIGQDVGVFGGAYREFAGLHARFGEARVRDAPVAEAAMVGVGVGAAAAGARTLVSITYMDFLMLGLDALVNYAAKARFKTGGQITVPLVVKTTAGARGQGVAHSQCLEAWMMGVPGLKVVAPSNAADAYGLMASALAAPGPVLFVDHKRLFPMAGEVPAKGGAVALGLARIARPGADVTIATHGYMTHVAMAAAERLATAGVEAEVVDLRTLAPLDIGTLRASAARTGHLLTLEEGQLACGVGAEVILQVSDHVPGLRAARVGALPAPVSSNPVLEAAVLPDATGVAEAAMRLLRARKPS